MPSDKMGPGFRLRVCDLCGGVDNHPRHVVAGGLPDLFPRARGVIVQAVIKNAPAAELEKLLGELLDTSSSDRHMDCCREADCPDGSCHLWTRGAEAKRGKALLTHLESLTEADVERLAREIIAEGEALSIVKGE